MKSWKAIARELERATRDLEPPSDETLKRYRRDFERLLAARTAIRSRRTFYRYRAALRWMLQYYAHQWLAWREIMDPNGDKGVDPELEALADVTLRLLAWVEGGSDDIQDNLEAGRQCAFAAQRPASSKRDGLELLPDDWREQVLVQLRPNFRDWCAGYILALTGLRRSELERGIVLSCWEGRDGLQIDIPGSKVTGDRGQPMRSLRFQADWPMETITFRRFLGLRRPGDRVVFQFPGRRLNRLLAQASRKLFPEVAIAPSPVSFRHQLASDLKAAGESPERIALILGHCSARTQWHYGRSRSGRAGAVKPVRVRATRPVRALIRPATHIVSGNTAAACEGTLSARGPQTTHGPGNGGGA